MPLLPLVATCLLVPIQIPLAIKWIGFDAKGIGDILVSIRRPDRPEFYAYDPRLGWINSATEVFYPESEFRTYFERWVGGFQLGLKLNQIPLKARPVVTEIRYGYETIGDITDYTIKYQLTQFLNVPADFTRALRINGTHFPIPKGFDPTLITEAGAFQVGTIPIDKPITKDGDNFVLPAPVNNVTHQLHFKYPVSIDTQNEHIPQIETVPCAFFRNISTGNLRFLQTKVGVSINTQTVRVLTTPYMADIMLDVLVFGDTAADVNSISTAMMAKIASTGGFWNPGFNCDCLVQLTSPVSLSPSSPNTGGNPASGMLFSNTLKLKLANIPHGTFYTEQPRISEIAGIEQIIRGESRQLSNRSTQPISPRRVDLSPRSIPARLETITFMPTVPLTVWTIDHNFGNHPIVVVYSPNGDVVSCSVTHITSDRVVCTFAVPFLGYAELTPIIRSSLPVLRE